MSRIDELLKLSAAERLELAEALWDSVAAEAETPSTVSAEMKAEIERRLAEHEADPTTALPWEEVRARLWAKIG